MPKTYKHISLLILGSLILAGCATTQPSATDTSDPDTESASPSKQNYFFDHCENDSELQGDWEQDQAIFKKFDLCVGAFQLVPAEMPQESPTTQISSIDDLMGSKKCKITNDPNVDIVRAFLNSNQNGLKESLHPSPDTVYQVIPLQSKDAPNVSGNSPSADYQKYFDFLSTWTKYVSDGDSSVEFRVPDQYLEFPGKIGKYKVGHKNHDDPGHIAFANDVSKVIDGKLDINSADMILIVVPAGTDLGVIEQGPVPLVQNGRRHPNSTALSPALTMENADPKYNLWFSHPMGVLHELYHIGPGLEDHVGTAHGDKWGVKEGDEIGTGQWGVMSSGITDLLAWEKWYMGFMLDSQIRCAKSDKESTHWLAPSTIKTTKPKLLVIPLGRHEALIIESMRSKGLNYKLPKMSEGALVYHLNASEPRRDFSYQVLGPEGRRISTSSFLLADWTMKQGESIDFKGVQISVIESGEFGDVIEVRPSS